MQRINPNSIGNHAPPQRQLQLPVTRSPQPTPEEAPNPHTNDSPGILASCCSWLFSQPQAEPQSNQPITELAESKQPQNTAPVTPTPAKQSSYEDKKTQNNWQCNTYDLR